MKDVAFILRRLATVLAVVALTLTLTAALTGVLLAFYYEPTAGGAYTSLKSVATEVSNGWLILTIHNLAGNALIVVALLQIVVMFLGERLRRSWITAWIGGILLTLTAIGLSWTAMILDWSQLGFWRLRIELSTIEAIPLIGSQLRDILTGGALGSSTVERMYSLHSYVLAIGAVVLSIGPLGALLVQEREMRQAALARQAEQPAIATPVSQPSPEAEPDSDSVLAS